MKYCISIIFFTSLSSWVFGQQPSMNPADLTLKTQPKFYLSNWAADEKIWHRKRKIAAGVFFSGLAVGAAGFTAAIISARQPKYDMGLILGGVYFFGSGLTISFCSIPAIMIRTTGIRLRNSVNNGSYNSHEELLSEIRSIFPASIAFAIMFPHFGIPYLIYLNRERSKLELIGLLPQFGFYASPMDAGICMRW